MIDSAFAFPTELEPFVSAAEASRFVRLHPATVQRLAREGALPGHPVGNGQRKRWRFRLSELQAWLSARSGNDSY
jgi:excisionase family DNA binding protein